MLRYTYLLIISVAILLSGCDKLGIEDPAKIAERMEAEGKAVGGACRHAGRAIEDCYQLNPRASKASVFEGWREMNEYMMQNKMTIMVPTLVNEEKKFDANVLDKFDTANADAPKAAEIPVRRLKRRHKEAPKAAPSAAATTAPSTAAAIPPTETHTPKP